MTLHADELCSNRIVRTYFRQMSSTDILMSFVSYSFVLLYMCSLHVSLKMMFVLSVNTTSVPAYKYYHCPMMLVRVLLRWISFFFFKQKTAYEMRISDWSSDVCSSDLWRPPRSAERLARVPGSHARPSTSWPRVFRQSCVSACRRAGDRRPSRGTIARLAGAGQDRKSVV